MGPEGVQGAIGKPPGRTRRCETLRNGKAKRGLSPALHKECVSCERFRPPAGGRGTFPARESTQRAPGAAKGCMSRGRPDPPLLSYSAPLASQGRAQLGSLASLGGPLSPSAQSIPPPAFGRRLIPGVMARARGSRNPPGPRRIAALHAAGYGEQQEHPIRIG